MSKPILGVSRRTFLKRAAAASAAAAAQSFPLPNVLRAGNLHDKLNCVVIGCGVRGRSHVERAVRENLLAIVDVDEKQHVSMLKLLRGKAPGASKIQTFADYRRMFDKLHKQIDAVFVATPNHQHALPSMIAMQLGKGIYCEKPLCHDIAEARRLRAVAERTKVPTQMGNQGHCEAGYRRLCEYVWAGVIGKITETHSWTDRANGGRGPRPPSEPVPAGLHWDAWIGPAPFRDFHSDLHPHEWHGWYDFGNGSLGNLGCHVLDGVCWALKLEHPQSIEAEEVFGGSDERCPVGTTIRWDFPARGEMPPLRAYWYDGRRGPVDLGDGPKSAKHKHGPRNLPPLLAKLQKQYPEEKFEGSGTLYVGEKGILYTGCYGNDMHVLPKKKMEEIAAPPQSLPRPKDSFSDFLRACRAGRPDTATNFDYGARLTELILLGNLAQRAGQGKTVEWDGPNMKVTNLTELNRWIQRTPRKGWQVS
jgi:predicted dehydrogenase